MVSENISHVYTAIMCIIKEKGSFAILFVEIDGNNKLSDMYMQYNVCTHKMPIPGHSFGYRSCTY